MTPPLLAAPVIGRLEPLPGLTRRFVAARSGLYTQVSRPWATATALVAPATGSLPYGDLEEELNLLCGGIPIDLVVAFARMAREAHPLEAGAWITWHQESRTFALRALESITATTAHLAFSRPRLQDGEWLVLDLHSHGSFRAGFSHTDDLDDRDEFKIACVLGQCGSEELDVAVRLCCYGTFLGLPQIEGGIREAFSPYPLSVEGKR